jgi:hypothetical protein
VATSSPRHWLLIRRKIGDPSDLAFFYTHAPGLVCLSILIKVAGKGGRWRVLPPGEGAGRPGPAPAPPVALLPPATVLSMCALALLAVTTARHPVPWAADSLGYGPPRHRPGPAPVPLANPNTGATPAPSQPVPARNHPATSA